MAVWGAGNGSAGGFTTAGPTFTTGGGPISPYSASPMPPATSGSTVSNSGSTNTPVAGPNGPFSTLGSPLSANASSLLTAGNTLLGTQFDPNNTLYNQQLQQERNQNNVNEAQRGITMSPYGAGVANQADINFNSNWQNQLQQRQLNAIQGASQAMNPATGLYNSSYGSSNTGYSTQPPSQQGGGGSATNESGLLSYPNNIGNSSVSSPYMSPISPQQPSYNMNPTPIYGPNQQGNPSNTLIPYDASQMQPPQPTYGQPNQSSNQGDTLQSYQNNYTSPSDPGSGYQSYSGNYGNPDNGSGSSQLSYDPNIIPQVTNDISAIDYLSSWS